MEVKATTQKRFYVCTQFLVYNGVDILQSAFQRQHFFSNKVHLAVVRFLVHGFSDGFQPLTLLFKSFLLSIFIITEIRVRGLIHHAHRILKANNEVFKRRLGILRKGWPRFSYPAFYVAHQAAKVFATIGIGSRLIIEIVNNVGRCAGDNQRIHSMVTMVDTLFHKSALAFRR